MNIALTNHWEGFVEMLVSTGRYISPCEVVGAALRELEAKEGEVFPVGSLAHLYSPESNNEESRLARQLRMPSPHEV